eukprot:11219858-Lingulodinium_polyedra.AAC.1
MWSNVRFAASMGRNAARARAARARAMKWRASGACTRAATRHVEPTPKQHPNNTHTTPKQHPPGGTNIGFVRVQ